MANYYFITQTNNTAALARGEVEKQLKQFERIYSKLKKFIEKYSEKSNQEDEQIFLAQMFLGGSYEVVNSFLGESSVKQRRETEPTFEFFYHCRNAAFHGNRFNFKHSQPRLPAWKSYTIDDLDEGKKLFPDKLPIDEATLLLKDITELF